MRIYLADLAAYNNGFLHGVWIDASNDIEDMEEQAQTMIEASPVQDAEEYEVHDVDGLPSYVRSLKDVAAYMELIEEVSRQLYGAAHRNNDEAAEIVRAYTDHFGSYEVSGSDIADQFRGFWDSEQAFADEQADEMIADLTSSLLWIKDISFLVENFDYESHCRTLFCSDYVFEAGIVFSTR